MKKIIKAAVLFLLICQSTLVFSENGVNGKGASSSDSVYSIVIDRNFSDWGKIPSLISFSAYYNPYYFNKESGGKIDVHKIEDSFYWKHNGTQLKDIRAIIQNDRICFYFSSQSPVSEGLIIYLYLFKDRKKGESNSYTIEIRIDLKKNSGILYLWEKGKKEAVAVGNAALSQKEIECEISMAQLPRLLADDLLTLYSFDLTTCFYEKASGIYEEFFFTTAFFRDIPSLADMK